MKQPNLWRLPGVVVVSAQRERRHREREMGAVCEHRQKEECACVYS